MTDHLFNIIPCGIFCFADDGNVVEVNDTLCSILHYSPADLRGSNVEKIFTLSTRIFFQTHLFPLVKMRGHAEEIFLTMLSSKAEHLPVLLNAKRITIQEEMITCCAFIIVPNRKKFEDELVSSRNTAQKALRENTELIQAKEELFKHTEKLEHQMQLVARQNHELKQFSHVVTHNLKEPLRKTSIYASKLQADIKSPNLEKLIRSNEQMKTVLGGLQQYVWLNEKSNRFSILSLKTIIENAVKQLAVETDSGSFELTVEKTDQLEGDEEQLQLMFYHILSNAVKFRNGEKASIRIHSDILKQNKFRSLGDKYKYEDFVRIQVTDNGMGFESIYKEGIFELFKKMHYSSGQGVGLALCKKIAENHHGFIEAESKVNLYTTIIIWLPVKQSTVS